MASYLVSSSRVPLCLGRRLLSTSSLPLRSKAPKMSQVEVDEPHVQERLGRMQMNFVKKAEAINEDRASKHRFFRRGDTMIAGGCLAVACSIYAYTIYAIKQERFLDDFDMPDPLAEAEEQIKEMKS